MKSNFFENAVIKRAMMSKIVGGNDITDPGENPILEGAGNIAVPRNVVGIGVAVAVGITDPELDG